MKLCCMPRAHKKGVFSTPTYQTFLFALPEGRGGYEDPSAPLHHIISYANDRHSKSFKIKGQWGYNRADRQPPGCAAAAASVPVRHGAEQRRKRAGAIERGRNGHSLHSEETPATTLSRQDSLATKRLQKASRWRGLHLLLRGQRR